MKPLSFLFFALILSAGAQGQNRADVRFFDKFWNPVQRKENAAYIRKISDADSVYHVMDYNLSNILIMDGYFSTVSPALTHHGKATWYYESGQIQKIGYYRKNKPVGIHKEFYPNGQIMSETLYEGYRESILNRFDESGNSFLVDGTGTFTTTYMNQDYINEVFDNQLLRSYYVNTRGDTVYGKATKPAVYMKGGNDQFYKNLREDAPYPDKYRKIGTEGIVYVSFIIDPKGVMVEPRVVKSLGAEFDDIAIKTVMRNRDWKAAIYLNHPVPARIVAPVVFRHRMPESGYGYSGYSPMGF